MSVIDGRKCKLCQLVEPYHRKLQGGWPKLWVMIHRRRSPMWGWHVKHPSPVQRLEQRSTLSFVRFGASESLLSPAWRSRATNLINLTADSVRLFMKGRRWTYRLKSCSDPQRNRCVPIGSLVQGWGGTSSSALWTESAHKKRHWSGRFPWHPAENTLPFFLSSIPIQQTVLNPHLSMTNLLS